jgi:hypothetical protein
MEFKSGASNLQELVDEQDHKYRRKWAISVEGKSVFITTLQNYQDDHVSVI